MDLTFTGSEQAFRDELRAWISDDHPGEAPRDPEQWFDDALAWQRRLHAGGWAGEHWPMWERDPHPLLERAPLGAELLGDARVHHARVVRMVAEATATAV